MDENDAIQIGVYQIDKNRFDANLEDTEIIDSIIESHNSDPKINERERFIEQPLDENYEIGDFTVRIFYSHKTRSPKWIKFLRPTLSENAQLVQARNTDASYIGFVADAENIYAVSGGQGNFVIQNFINEDFGTDVITRLISKDSKGIRSLQERGVTGSVLGSTKFFRGDYRLSDEDEFGKIYKQIKADLKKQILIDVFGFSEDDVTKDVGCFVKSSFQINKAISFEKLLEVLGKITQVLNEEQKFSLNKVQIISRRYKKNKELLNNLNAEVVAMMYRFLNENTPIDFDFCHQKFDEYLTADHYQIYRGYSKTALLNPAPEELSDICILLSRLRDDGNISLGDIEEFKQSVESLQINSYDAENSRRTAGSLFAHIHGEVVYNNKSYFRVDGEWYEVKDTFIQELNTDCQYVVNENISTSILTKQWSLTESENQYNRKYIGEQNFLVFDKITPQNIEMCDILKFDDNAVYLIHVKKGFDNSIRDLCAQILISARRIFSDVKSGQFEFIQAAQTSLESKANSTDEYFRLAGGQTIPTGGLSSIFAGNKELVFCFAFIDEAGTPRNISENVEGFNSNIAKFALIELEKSLRVLGGKINFKIIQIQRQ